MFEILSISQIAAQATRDARDTARGAVVHNPYHPHRPEAAALWQDCFDKWTAGHAAQRELEAV